MKIVYVPTPEDKPKRRPTPEPYVSAMTDKQADALRRKLRRPWETLYINLTF